MRSREIDDSRWTGILKEIDHVYLLARAQRFRVVIVVLVVVVDLFRNYR